MEAPIFNHLLPPRYVGSPRTRLLRGLPANLSAGVHAAAIPPPVFPAGVATTSDLLLAGNRVITMLVNGIGPNDTTITVADPRQIQENMVVSLDRDGEIVKILGSAVGGTFPVERGFDSTIPTAHPPGALVLGNIVAWHHNALVAEIEAIENALGPNLSNVPAFSLVMSAPFNFVPQSPGGSLIIGANAITLTPVPPGVSGNDVGHYVYISGGIGTPEAALIIGGNAVGGQPSGTLVIECANTHSGAWTISSATGGIQEAVCSLPAAGGEVYVNASATLYANVGPCGKTSVLINKMAGRTIAGNFTIFGQSSAVDGRAEIFSFATPSAGLATSGTAIQANNATFNDANPTYSALIGNVNNFPVAGLNPIQFVASGVLGAVSVPASAVNGNGSGVLGLCTTSSTTCASCGISAYANTLVDGCRAWGANLAVSNQTSPTGTTGVHALSMIGLEIDVNVFGPGNSDSVAGIQIIGGSSNIQPPTALGIQIAPLGNAGSSIGQPKWTAGLQFYVGACKAAIEIQQEDTGNDSASQAITLISTDPTGNVYSSDAIQLAADGTLTLTGGNGPDPKGIDIQDGAGNSLIYIQSFVFQIRALSVYADNAGAIAGGLPAGALYRTATGQVMQRY